MRRAWVAFLAGCGFQVQAANTPPPSPDASIPDVQPDAELVVQPVCWSVDGLALHMKACAPPVAMIDIATDVTLDTTPGATNQPFPCASLTTDSTTDACALVAGTIQVRAGVTLSAHGTRPLALLAHTLEVAGTIDVAAHSGGSPGPGSNPDLCRTASGLQRPTLDGGGQGGTHDNKGGNGGNGGVGSGGHAGGTSSLDTLYGGCPGWGNGGLANPEGVGGQGGGAVWLAVDTGTLTIAASATINASGAGGPGGTAAVNQRGGYGGGAGGRIVLQATANTLSLDLGATLFANGGHGGGGASTGDGAAGTDPTGPASGGDGGDPGTPGIPGTGHAGAGGTGYPTTRNGGDGDMANGGGGGGGGEGAIQLFPFRSIAGLTNVSPPPSEP